MSFHLPSTIVSLWVKGEARQRIFIRNYLKEGDYVVSVDNDIEELFRLSRDKLTHLKQVKTFFEHSLEELKREKKYMWGLSSA